MKAYDVYKRTCAIMFEREREDSAFCEKFTELLGALLSECLPYENSIREAEGREKLASAPVIADMEDELCFSDAICAVALPFGIAAYFYQDDGESYNSSLYRARFISALSEAAKCCFRDVEDVYGGETE